MNQVGRRFGVAILLICAWLAAGLSAEAQTSQVDMATLPADIRALSPRPESSHANMIDNLSRLNALHKSALTELNAVNRRHHIILAGSELYGPLRGTYEFALFRADLRKVSFRLMQIASAHDFIIAEMHRRSFDIAAIPAHLAKRPEVFVGFEAPGPIEPSCMVIKTQVDCAKRADCGWAALFDSKPNLPLGGRPYCVDKRDAESTGDCWPMRKC